MKRFIDCYIPIETCNLKCHYCYIAQQKRFTNKVEKLKHKPEEIRKALSKERMGGVCLFNLCAGGETLIAREVIQVVRALLEEGHYVMIVTNGTLTNRFKEIANFPNELLKHLFFKFSFHYLELKRINMLDTFFSNIDFMKKSGASFTVEITPNDELEPYINEIKEISIKKLGALPHLTIGRKDTSKEIPVLTSHSFDNYLNIWKDFDSELFNYKSMIFGEKRKEFCYAGEWSAYLNIQTGELSQCYGARVIDNIYKEPKKPIKFLPIGCNCKLAHCYNGHAFLSLGVIPELNAPTYDILRNRICSDGTEWLNSEMKCFMNSKLRNENDIYDNKQKKNINIKNKRDYILYKSLRNIRKIVKTIRGGE